MKIERVDDKTVKCFISNEELEEFDITYKDFITRTDRAREVVEEIIEQAMAEVDYKPPQFAMDMQIMMMPEKGMVLTLSEKSPEDLKNNPKVMEYLQGMRKALEEHMGLEGKPEEKPDSKEMKAAKPAEPAPDVAIFKMASLRALCDYARILPKNLRVDSCLYRDKDAYYLYIHKGGASYKRYSRACIQALEYGILYGAGNDKLVYLDEHAECLIPEKALARLRL